ncbi:MAG: hypothetical protein ABR568_15005 [Pyrinomonadaceae bacterium]
MNGILVLLVALVGLNFIFGEFKTERLTRLLIWLVLAPLAVCLAQGFIYGAYSQLTPTARLLLLILLPFVLLSLLRSAFPSSRAVTDAVLNALVYLLTLPVRILWRSLRLVMERERHRIDLSRTPVVVGRRPQQNRATDPQSGFMSMSEK